MKVAVAGLGWWGKQIISCLQKSPRFEVLYGIDPKPPADIEEFRKSHKFTLDTTLDKALADPAIEGVVLATPHALHEEQALRVIAAGKNGDYGLSVDIDHGMGIVTRYGHLSGILVRKGQTVTTRQQIGLMGQTGRATGVHVHYEIQLNGKPIDPMKFIQAGRYVFKG